MIYNDRERREHIRELQKYLYGISLKDKSIPGIIPDGFYGNETEKAVEAFQNQYGLPVTGEADKNTWDMIALAYRHLCLEKPSSVKMFPENTDIIKEGDSGCHVQMLRLMLNGLSGIYSNMPSVSHGKTYDGETSESVRFIQSCSGYPVTGETDKYTWNIIAGLFENSEDQ